MNCCGCNKEFEVLNVFSPFGHNNPYKIQESIKNNGYCDNCFKEKNLELENIMHNNKEEIAS